MKTRIKTCDRCRALYMSQYDISCDLGFDLVLYDGETRPSGKDGICPKPKTFRALIFWKKHYGPAK